MKTLVSPSEAPKARPGGAGAPGGPSEALPEKIYPARVRLAGKLAELERACADLEDYKARAARAEVDAQKAMENDKLTESEAAVQIQTAQAQRGVYQARQTQREKAIATLSTELSTVIREANAELQGLVNAELTRRTDVISARVLEAIEAIDRPGRKAILAELLDYSAPIHRIYRLAPLSYMPMSGSPEYLLGPAKDTLTKFDQVIAEGAKKL